MYQIFPERFANGDSSINPKNIVDWGSAPTRLDFQGGDLFGVIQNLDHIESLGVKVFYDMQSGLQNVDIIIKVAALQSDVISHAKKEKVGRYDKYKNIESV